MQNTTNVSTLHAIGCTVNGQSLLCLLTYNTHYGNSLGDFIHVITCLLTVYKV